MSATLAGVGSGTFDVGQLTGDAGAPHADRRPAPAGARRAGDAAAGLRPGGAACSTHPCWRAVRLHYLQPTDVCKNALNLADNGDGDPAGAGASSMSTDLLKAKRLALQGEGR